MDTVSREMAELASYLSRAAELELPDDVRQRGAMHTLDALAAVISGSEMPAGLGGRRWADQVYGSAASGPATVVGRSRGSVVAAALCNGMSAHADETDDSHMETHSHPGCSIVPAAVAVAEEVGASGEDLLRAVVAGYDTGCRVGRATGLAHQDMGSAHRSSHALVGAFGSAAAAAVLYRLDPVRIRYVLSYTSQLASGVSTWMRDTEHVEKAFVFAGMPASQGVLAASLVASGCTGVEDVFSGSPNWLEALSDQPDRAALSKGLGSDYEVMRGTLKKYSVGSPAQAAVEAVIEMMREEGLSARGVRRIVIQLPSNSAMIVDSRAMPNINVQYLVAGTLLDGKFSFAMAHDEQRMRSPEVADLISRTELVRDDSIKGTRHAAVTVERDTDSGLVTHTRHVGHVRGTPALPMNTDEVRAKAMDLIAGVIGESRAAEFCDRLLSLGSQDKVRSLLALLG